MAGQPTCGRGPRVGAWRGDVAVLSVLLLGGCTAGTTPQDDITSPASPAVVATIERSELIPRRTLTGLPTRFPESLDAMPAYTPAGAERARLLYRPYESAGDGAGWGTESIGIRYRDGSWERLDLDTIGLDEAWWPGPDPIGTGDLSPDGVHIAWSSAAGVLVFDLRTGEHRQYLADSGPVAGVRWHPNGRELTANTREGPDRRVDTSSGTVAAAEVPMLNLVFLPDGTPATARHEGDGLAVRAQGSASEDEPDLLVDAPDDGGELIRGWSSSTLLALSALDGERRTFRMPAVDPATGAVVGVLTWQRRMNPWVDVEGWWTDGMLLVSVDQALVGWSPAEGTVVRVSALPPSDVGGAHGSVGLSLAR